MTRSKMDRIVREADESKQEEAREIGSNLMRKYVLPNMSTVPAGQIFFSKEGYGHIFNRHCDDAFKPFIRIFGYFSPTEVPDYESPYKDVFILRDSSEMDKYYTEVRQKEKTYLSREVIHKMKEEELQKMCDHAFDEENLVGYWYEQEEDEKTGLISFEARFYFV